MSDQHFLVVGEYIPDEPMDCLEIEHPDSCPQEGRRDSLAAEWNVTSYDCEVGYSVQCESLETFFRHKDDPAESYSEERVDTGRYPIEAWSETYHGPDYTEYGGGIRLAAVKSGIKHSTSVA